MPILPELDLDQARASSPNNSYLETCVLLWSLGDYFLLPDLCQLVLSLLSARCRKLFADSRSIRATINEISFLPDIEAGIRAAWKGDRVAGPVRRPLMTVCSGLHPVLRDQKSFINLIGEIPEFATDFLKALLGCDGMQMSHAEDTRLVCCRCDSTILVPDHGEGKRFVKGALIWTPISLNIHTKSRRLFCSKKCYNSGV